MQNQKLTRTVILLCLTLAVVEFSLRGPLRTLLLGTFTDFSGVYVASRQWVSNSDPYRASQFMQTWVAAGARPLRIAAVTQTCAQLILPRPWQLSLRSPSFVGCGLATYS